MSQWGQGRATVDQMLASGQLERVPPNRDAADALLAKAGTHLKSAAALVAALSAAIVQGCPSAERNDGQQRQH